jgi:Fasciclin domain.
MKRSILFGKYLVAMVLAAMIFQTGCKPEKGMHDAVPVANTTNLTTYEYLRSKTGVYDSLLMLVDKFPGLKQTLTDSTITLFAPSNASFRIAIQNLNDLRKSRGQDPVYLSQLAAGAAGIVGSKNIEKAKRDSAALDTMVSMYIIRKKFIASDFAIGDGQTVFSVRGGYPMHGQRIFADAEGFQNGGVEAIEYSDTKRSLFTAKWSKTQTTSVNIKTKNGIVHLLRPDHTFGFDSFIARTTLVPPPPVAWNLATDLLFPYWPPSSQYYDGQVSAGEVFKKALDGSVLTKFISNVSAGNNYYPSLYWVPAQPTVANAYTMTTANDSKLYRDRDPRAFKIEATLDPNPWVLLTNPLFNDKYGPNPDAVWVQLDVRQDQEWTTNYQQKRFDFINNVAYTAYRLVILQVGIGGANPNLFQISEWTMNIRSN